MKIDCSECRNCYGHKVYWGEFWCRVKEQTSNDGYVYDVHSLKSRFKKNCINFESKRRV